MRVSQKRLRNLSALALRLAPSEGLHSFDSVGLTVKRVEQSLRRVPVFYDPCAVFVVQGQKRAYFGRHRFQCDQTQFLLLSRPIPFVADAVTDQAHPMLAVYIKIERDIVFELAQKLGLAKEPLENAEPPIIAASTDPCLYGALQRLLDAAQNQTDRDVLGLNIRRELIYRILQGPSGGWLCRAMGYAGHPAQVTRVISFLRAHFSDDLNTRSLCQVAGMSSSVLHVHFRSATGVSPMQFLKSVRLHRAKTLLLNEKPNASEVARRVGYKSPAQFSRDFKKLFGTTPARSTNLPGPLADNFEG